MRLLRADRSQLGRDSSRLLESAVHPARFVVIISPLGFKQYFTEVAALLAAECPPDWHASLPVTN